ncbi:DUF58 domain-containing protein [Pyrococcus horikoshii]|nr:DUF58 domain-containing protein [Pyrococcus horikoshii]HII61091.1 DUF58 domain-containing protein [Pyrococcus horikoshii]
MKGASFFVTLFLWFIVMSLIFGVPGKLAVFPLLLLIMGLLFDAPGDFEVEREIEKAQTFVGNEIEVLVRVRVGRGIGLVMVRENIPKAFMTSSGSNVGYFFTYPGRRSFQLSYKLLPLKRGVYEIPKTEIISLHFLRIHPMKWGLYGGVNEIVVLPKIGITRWVRSWRALESQRSQISKSLSGVTTLEFKEIREYKPGDPFKVINWKATARTGKLLVNEYEKEGQDTIILFLDARMGEEVGSIVENPLEYGIELAYALSIYLLGRGSNVGLYIIGQGKMVTPSSSLSHRDTILKALIASEYRKEETFEEAFKKSAILLRKFNPKVVIITNVIPEVVEEIKKIGKNRNTLIVDVSVYCKLSEDICPLINLKKLALYRKLGARVIPWDVSKYSTMEIIGKIVGVL